MRSVALVMPAWSPAWMSWTSTSKPRRSAQRLYMRKSMSAQSHDSVPPAPGLDGEDGVVAVELAREEGGDLELVELRRPSPRRSSPSSLSCASRSAGAELSTSSTITSASSTFFWNATTGRTARLSDVQLRDVLLGPLVVVPEARLAHLGLHGLYLPAFLVDVKETSTSGRRAS